MGRTTHLLETDETPLARAAALMLGQLVRQKCKGTLPPNDVVQPCDFAERSRRKDLGHGTKGKLIDDEPIPTQATGGDHHPRQMYDIIYGQKVRTLWLHPKRGCTF